MSKLSALKSSPSLSSVQEGYSQTKLPTPSPNEYVTKEEINKMETIQFAKELKFEADPLDYVKTSKSAFKNFVSGIPDGVPYYSLFEQRPFNPGTPYPYPMGENMNIKSMY